MTTVAIGLGCNLGNRLRTLWAAVHILRQRGIRIAAASDVFETPPWGVQDQPLFLNACLVAETDCSPEELLALLKETEEALGRRPGERWGPREIDLDILFYGQEMVQTETLTVPHKEMANRGFVLLPLEQIAPTWRHPGNGCTVREMAERLPDSERRLVRICALL
ncbi:MAG TPA: 2-amino-4-hydroxy-6-hydroxymethyldihydropteridine diphosphokinase [Synergistaceae bacterium]|nr:2-amino-4-hydroxy-6-hydroxymethyldihydropteridine diphosphokinase [Synergistaceae bacterium]